MAIKTKEQLLGKKGEEHAVQYLKRKGFEISKRNFRIGRAEVDIIAKTEMETVFVEVKTRSTNHFGQPEEFVSERQQQVLINAAEKFSLESKTTPIRFDIISVIIEKNAVRLKHFEDAFWPLL